MRRHLRRASATVAVGTLVLATFGCSGDEPGTDAMDLPESGSSAAASSGSGDAQTADTSAPAEIPTSYPGVGLEFTDLPDLTGTEREALRTYVDYERGMRRLSRTGQPNALITDHAAPAMRTTVDSTVEYLRSTDTRYRGTAGIAVAVDGAGGRAAVFDLCIDGTDLELIRGGSAQPIEGPERVPARVVVSREGGTWRVSQYETLETSC